MTQKLRLTLTTFDPPISNRSCIKHRRLPEKPSELRYRSRIRLGRRGFVDVRAQGLAHAKVQRVQRKPGARDALSLVS